MFRATCNFNSFQVPREAQCESTRNTDISDNTKPLLEVIRHLEGSTPEIYDISETIFFPGDNKKKLYLIKKGAVRLSRIYENGDEITVALLKEKSLFGVSSLLPMGKSDSFYHAIAFTHVEIETAPASSVKNAIEIDPTVGMLLLQALSERILQSSTMIETLKNKDTYSRLISFLLVLSKDFGVPSSKGITIDLKITQAAIAEAIGSTRVTVTRLFVELKNSGLLASDRKKITIIDPTALAKLLE